MKPHCLPNESHRNKTAICFITQHEIGTQHTDGQHSDRGEHRAGVEGYPVQRGIPSGVAGAKSGTAEAMAQCTSTSQSPRCLRGGEDRGAYRGSKLYKKHSSLF